MYYETYIDIKSSTIGLLWRKKKKTVKVTYTDRNGKFGVTELDYRIFSQKGSNDLENRRIFSLPFPPKKKEV